MYHAVGVLLDQEACDLMVRVGIHKLGVPRNGVGSRGRVGYHSTEPEETMEVFRDTERLLLKNGVIQNSWQAARLLTVFPSCLLNLHEDRFETVPVRYHLVVETNPEAWVRHDGRWQQLELGVLYWMDPTKPHASVNLGQTPRTHLFFDVPA